MKSEPEHDEQPAEATHKIEVTEVTQKPTTASTPVTPATLILQWLTYAFWGLTVLALSVLIFLVVFNLMNGSNSETASLYTIAAIVVLLPISLVCDFLYQKREPLKKTGASAAILAIHAVIFALFGIGVLVSGLFAVIRLITDINTTAQSQSEVAWLISSLIVTILYAAVFVRTINPAKTLRWLPKVHAITMGVVIVLFTVLAFVGPFADTFKGKNDRLIRENLSALSDSVEQYTIQESHLPNTLSDLSMRSQTLRHVIDENLVTIKKDAETSDEIRYQLCTTYTTAYKGTSYDSYNYDVGSDGYYSYPSTDEGHEPGKHCYKLKIDKQKVESPGQYLKDY